jgi:hypothetical protein
MSAEGTRLRPQSSWLTGSGFDTANKTEPSMRKTVAVLPGLTVVCPFLAALLPNPGAPPPSVEQLGLHRNRVGK